MSSIKDVARLAGVSVTTVSHVLNKTRSVLPATQERVQEAVQTLGYVPSAVARSLKTQATHTLGMLVPDNSNPYFAELVRAVEDACFAAGYALLLCNTDNHAGRQQVYLDVLSQKRVDGLIVASTSDDALMSQHLAQTALPMVLIDRAIAGLERPCVQTDHVQGGMLATQHLMAMGRKRIACVGGPQDLQSSEQRVQGWRQALQLVGLPCDLLVHGDFTVNGGYVAMQRLLRDPSTDLPTAVFACNDLMAIGALRAVHEAGLQVPRDVAVVGYDDIELASYTQPALSTVAQPTRAMAQQALAWLLERIQAGRSAEPAAARTQMLVPALVTRESSRASARVALPIVSGETL